MTPFVLDEDPGKVQVTILGVEQFLDMWKLWSALTDAADRTKSQPPAEYWAEVVNVLRGFGFPELSMMGADMFSKWFWKLRAELGKAHLGESGPDSPASTESEPSTNQPE